MKCEQCGKELKARSHESLQPWQHGSPQRFCGATCRQISCRKRKAIKSPEEIRAAEERVRARAERGFEFAMYKQEHGRKWFFSKHAAALKAAGLPGHCCLAAEMLGISESTLRKRLKHGTDLLAPLRPSTLNPAYVELERPKKEWTAKLKISKTDAQLARRDLKAKLNRQNKREDIEV